MQGFTFQCSLTAVSFASMALKSNGDEGEPSFVVIAYHTDQDLEIGESMSMILPSVMSCSYSAFSALISYSDLTSSISMTSGFT